MPLLVPSRAASSRCHLHVPVRPTMNRLEKRIAHSAEQCVGQGATFDVATHLFVPSIPMPSLTRTLRWEDRWWSSQLQVQASRLGRPDRGLQMPSRSMQDELEHPPLVTLARRLVPFQASGLNGQSRSREPPRNALHHHLVDRGPALQRKGDGCSRRCLGCKLFERCGLNATVLLRRKNCTASTTTEGNGRQGWGITSLRLFATRRSLPHVDSCCVFARETAA